MRTLCLGLLLALLAAVPASAATLKLKDGTRIECKVQRYDATTKTLYVRTSDGRDASYTMDQLDGRSVYQINASLVPRNDAQAQLLTANFARDAGLYAQAVRRYGWAVEIDPGLKATVEKEMQTLRRSAATMCAERARSAAAAGNFKEAEKWCKVLIEKLPDEPETAEAAAALDRYYERLRSDKIAAADAKASAALQKDVEKGKQRFAKMVESTKKGLQARGSAQAEGHFQSALRDGKAVLDEIDRIAKKYDDPAVAQQAVQYRKVVIDQMIEVHLHVASGLATKSDYRGAQKEVNEALALDPENERALSMRVRLEDYSSRGLGWGRWI